MPEMCEMFLDNILKIDCATLWKFEVDNLNSTFVKFNCDFINTFVSSHNNLDNFVQKKGRSNKKINNHISFAMMCSSIPLAI